MWVVYLNKRIVETVICKGDVVNATKAKKKIPGADCLKK
jgi:hypothetical protein